MQVLSVIVLVSLGHQSGKRREGGSDTVPEFRRPAVAVACGAGTGIAEPSGSDYEPRAQILPTVGEQHAEPVSRAFHRRHLGRTFDLHACAVAGRNQRVDHVRGAVRGRKSPVSPLHYTLHTEALEERYERLRRQRMESRPDKIRLGAYVSGEFVPSLDVGEVATPLAAYHYLACDAGHLLEHSDLGRGT